jgi:hypothetical protein
MPVSTLYNPQEMREDLFRRSFVVRRALLEDLLRTIREAAPGERFQHTILQGQRGQGKTTLLRKLSLCVRDDPELSTWLIPILFREEEYSVVALCRLWERTADYLAEHPGFGKLPEQFEAALESPHYEKDCFDILARSLEREDKHLLLLIDNFGEMLDKFGKTDQQRLREILLTSRRIRIVAGSAATLEQQYDHGKPFFNFFRLRTLEGLNAQEARELMLSLGDEDQKKRMAEILETRPGKLEALRRLTAGVPRTLILLFEIFLDDDGSAMEDLEVLLDRVTPLYKHCLDDLPTQQQAIVYEIAMGWDALSTREIAAKTRLDSKHISAQLQYLEKNRIVQSESTSKKNKLYCLEERFFNIWCLMRLGRAGDKRRAVWLVRFLEIWCDQEELAERVRRHIAVLQQGKIAPSHATFLTHAFLEILNDPNLRRDLLGAAGKILKEYQVTDFIEINKPYYISVSDVHSSKNLVNLDVKKQKPSNQQLTGLFENIATFIQKLIEALAKIGESLLIVLNDPRTSLFFSSLSVMSENYSLAFQFTELAILKIDTIDDSQLNFLEGNIRAFAAKNQTAFALKLFEDEKYAALNLKERLKPLYYAILREAGPSRADDALRMGPELEETVEEIRREIERMRQDYRIDATDITTEDALLKTPAADPV